MGSLTQMAKSSTVKIWGELFHRGDYFTHQN